jgi:glutamyl endopeptidase
MPSAILSAAAHAPSGSIKAAEAPKRLLFAAGTRGVGRTRGTVDPAGFEKIAGFSFPAYGARAAVAPARAMSELTYGTVVSAQAALGPTQAVVPNTNLYPFSSNAALRITVPGKSEVFWATGWFVGQYAVITAAHVVYPREPGGYVGWASEIEVVPGQDGLGNPPSGVKSSTFFCPTGWQSDGDQRLDYGVILLSQGAGANAGTYGYGTYSDADLQVSVANLAGYPLTAPDPAQPAGKQWYGANNVASVDDSFVYYNLSTLGGESGSAVYRNIGNDPFVMAIHTCASGNLDRGVRIIDPVYQNIAQWAQMHG